VYQQKCISRKCISRECINRKYQDRLSDRSFETSPWNFRWPRETLAKPPEFTHNSDTRQAHLPKCRSKNRPRILQCQTKPDVQPPSINRQQRYNTFPGFIFKPDNCIHHGCHTADQLQPPDAPNPPRRLQLPSTDCPSYRRRPLPTTLTTPTRLHLHHSWGSARFCRLPDPCMAYRLRMVDQPQFQEACGHAIHATARHEEGYRRTVVAPSERSDTPKKFLAECEFEFILLADGGGGQI